MKKAAISGGSYSSGHRDQRLYKGIRVVEIVIVEDVLVLACDRLIRHVHLVNGIGFVGVELVHPSRHKAVEVKSVFHLVGLGGVFVVGMLLQIVLLGVERRQAPKLQNTPISGHGGKLTWGHQLPAQPLGILAVAFGLAP